MKKFNILLPLLLLGALLQVTPALAGVQTQARSLEKPDAAPRDVALSADGKRSFVLSEGGLVTIYSVNGSVVDTFRVDPAMDHLSVDGEGNQLFLTSSEGKVSQVALDYRFEMDLAGSPFMGPADAPVVLAFYSDFQ